MKQQMDISFVAENTGSMTNIIRRNQFSGPTVSNEAFGQNSAENSVVGLIYLCNINADTEDKDFFIPGGEQSPYSINNINISESPGRAVRVACGVGPGSGEGEREGGGGEIINSMLYALCSMLSIQSHNTFPGARK